MMKNYLSKLIFMMLAIFGAVPAFASTGPGTPGGSTGPGTPATPIDMYLVVLGAVAVAMVVYFATKKKAKNVM